jgi:hypothetical protein
MRQELIESEEEERRSRAEPRAEQSRCTGQQEGGDLREERRAEQSRAEQSRAEYRAGQSRAEQSRAEQSRVQRENPSRRS